MNYKSEAFIFSSWFYFVLQELSDALIFPGRMRHLSFLVHWLILSLWYSYQVFDVIINQCHTKMS